MASSTLTSILALPLSVAAAVSDQRELNSEINTIIIITQAILLFVIWHPTKIYLIMIYYVVENLCQVGGAPPLSFPPPYSPSPFHLPSTPLPYSLFPSYLTPPITLILTILPFICQLSWIHPL